MKGRKGTASRRRLRRSRWADWGVLALLLAIMFAMSRLPTDTSLAQVQKSGVLRVCIPTAFSVLVTGSQVDPGIDVELMQAVARELDVRLVLNRNGAMGQDWNPRSWRLTRSQCQVIVGGVVGSATTKSFLDTTPPHMETGWALVTPGDLQSLRGATVGFYSATSGLDRIALSRYLRQQGARVVTVSSAADLSAGLRNGRFDAGVSEALTVRHIAGDNDWIAQWLPEKLGRYDLVFGLWKGDLTLKRAVVNAVRNLRSTGEFDAILNRYEIAPIDEHCSACS